MATKVTVVNGSTRTGVYAKDGSINVVIRNGSTRTGIYHPCGAFNIVVVSDLSKGLYHPSGAYNAVLLPSGQYRFGMWSGTGLGTGGGSVQPLGALVINGTPIVLNSIPVQKES